MLLITCPWCGKRDESEFSYGGEADIVRPANPAGLTDEQWGDYVFMRRNPLGASRELWNHVHGCRRWFIAERDTLTYTFGRVETPVQHKEAIPHKETTA